MIMAGCMSIMSCNRDNDDLIRTHIFKVITPTGADDSGTIEIAGRNQELPFKIFATSEWKASITGADGFSISTQSGQSGKTDVIVTVTPNNSGASRNATLIFYLSDALQYEYKIVQEVEAPYIEVSPPTISLPGDAGEFTITLSTNQSDWTYEIINNSGNWLTEKVKGSDAVIFSVVENKSFSPRSTDVKFYSTSHPEAFTYLTVEQAYKVDAPVADLLDVIFAEDGSAKDVSPMGMIVNLRADQYVSTTYLEKYERYAAVFSRTGGPYANQSTGYYTVPYTDNTAFKNKIEDGFSMETLIRRYDTPGTAQIKAFSAGQAGGTGICFRAGATNEIYYEIHTGGAWRNCYSGIQPQKDIYYHIISTWDKANGVAKLYVDGVLKATTSTSGDFKHMTTNVNAYWFGIGADPNANDLGEATFNGEVVLARMYDDPLSAEQVYSLWSIVNK